MAGGSCPSQRSWVAVPSFEADTRPRGTRCCTACFHLISFEAHFLDAATGPQRDTGTARPNP